MASSDRDTAKMANEEDDTVVESKLFTVSIENLNDDCLLSIFKYLRNKDRIRIERVCKRWKKLSLSSWRNVKEVNFTGDFNTKLPFKIEHLTEVLWRCGDYITHLCLHDIKNPNPRVIFGAINKYCKQLTHLEICEIDMFENELVKIAPKIAANLKSLQLKNCHIEYEDTLAKLLKKCVNLEELNMYLTHVYGESLFYLTKKCKKLSIDSCYRVDDATFAQILKRIPDVKELNISSTPLMPYHLQSISNQLVTLSLSSVFLFFEDVISFRTLTFNSLRKLDLSSNDSLTNGMMNHFIVHCPLLENLELAYCPNLSNPTFRRLEKLEKLKKLVVAATEINDRALEYLAPKLPLLEEFNAENCANLSLAGLTKFVGLLPELRTLGVGDVTKLTHGFLKDVVKLFSVKQKKNTRFAVTVYMPHTRNNVKTEEIVQREMERLKLVKRNDREMQNCLTNCEIVNISAYKYQDEEEVWYVRSLENA